jgi:thiol-disulfide isomerase/thioredoxin
MAIGTRMILGIAVVLTQIAAAQPLTVGQAAPKLVIGTIEQGRVEEKPGSRATVLEFWATWCPPCREAIPHLNELAEQFKDSPIDFISLTPESEETVDGFSQNSSNARSRRT